MSILKSYIEYICNIEWFDGWFDSYILISINISNILYIPVTGLMNQNVINNILMKYDCWISNEISLFAKYINVRNSSHYRYYLCVCNYDFIKQSILFWLQK